MISSKQSFIETYNSEKYWKPSLAADILLFVKDESNNNELKILLIKRKNHPYKNYWALPGGFLDEGETLLEAAHRELKEETNIEGINLKQLAVWDEPLRDPRTRVISVSFLGLAKLRGLNFKPRDDASEVKLFSIDLAVKENNLILNLYNNDYKLSAFVKMQKSEELSSQYMIKESKLIAFDHAKIILFGLKNLLKNASTNGIMTKDGRILIKD